MTHASLRPRYCITKTNHAEDCDQSTKAEVRIPASTSNRRMDGCGQNLREETRCSRKQDEHPRRDQDSGIGSNAATGSRVQMNQARFTTFDELLEEIMRYLEHKTGKSLKMASAASTLANQSSHLLGTKEDRKAVEASFSELVTTVAKPATKPQSVGPNRVRRDMRPATRKAHTEKVQGTRTRTLEKLEKDPRVDQ